MTQEQFNEILDFASDREKEAVKFYQDLQHKAKFEGMIEMLKELEMMETGHIAVIEGIRNKGIGRIVLQDVRDLHISEYISTESSMDQLDYQGILITAMKREENSTKLYSEMALRFQDSELEKLFHRLAQEEKQHKLYFEKLYDEVVLKDM
ncbi:MAG TPA: ferritin family protein [Candidatus Cloacimonadota bacterium]|nr:ferritin family protein [Candidatus Cloacimonadota bacterium]HPT72216.1 ferritin family protein [Candidatus Cloacimonadota bacterium]